MLIFSFTALFSASQPPARILVTFVPTINFLGSRTTNPYNFTNKFGTGADAFDINEVSLTLNDASVDGVDSRQFSAQYVKNFVLSDALSVNQTNGISLDEFQNGFFYMLFDLTTALEANQQLVSPVVRSGLGRLSIIFSTSTTQELTVLTLMEYASTLEIDKNRNIFTNYGA